MADENDAGAGQSQSLLGRPALIAGALGFIFLLAVAFAWRLTALKEIADFETIVSWQQTLKDQPATLFWVIAAYLAAGAVSFPVMILNVATVATFGPVLGNAYAFAGWLCSAALGFGAGRALGRQWLRKWAPQKLHHILNHAGHHGFLTTLSMRVLPIAPFTVVNLLIGACGIRFVDFFLATAVGRIPGLVTLTAFGVQLENFLRRPDASNLVMLALTILSIPLLAAWLSRRFVAQDPRRCNGGEP